MATKYTPTKSLAIVAAILFFIPALLHTIFIFRSYRFISWNNWYRLPRKAHFMWPFVIGVYLEAIGYVTRELSAQEVGDRAKGIVNEGGVGGSLAVTTVFIVIGPAWMAASHYMLFGRLCTLVREHTSSPQSLSPLPSRFTTVFFVGFDVVSIVTQIAGGIMAISDNLETVKNSGPVLKAAYMIQVVGMLLFMALAILARYRAKKHDIVPSTLKQQWSHCLRLLFLGGSIITFRCIYRFLEITITSNGSHPLNDHEALFYIFDTLLMLIVAYAFLVWYPAQYLLVPGEGRDAMREGEEWRMKEVVREEGSY